MLRFMVKLCFCQIITASVTGAAIFLLSLEPYLAVRAGEELEHVAAWLRVQRYQAAEEARGHRGPQGQVGDH